MQAEPEDLLSSYKQQAELYFKVIEQALNLLEGQPSHKTALKDIELACKSLYELLMKLNLDSIAKTPALMSEGFEKDSKLLVRQLYPGRFPKSS